MTQKQLIEICSLSGSLFALKLNTDKYSVVDALLNWAFSPMLHATTMEPEILNGELVNYGDNVFSALDNLILVYTRRKNHLYHN